jgi:hypothetical protein
MERRRLVLIWLATSVLVAGVLLLAYRSLASAPALAGRTDPEALIDDPETLFADPGALGSAIEMRVYRAIESCMAERGFDYRGPAAVEDLDQTLDPARYGYGIATGPPGGKLQLGAGGAGSPEERAAYEAALYGTGLDDAGAPSGCSAVGAAELAASLDTLESMPYSLRQLEEDTRNHPAMQVALAEWRSCMSAKGYGAGSPDELISGLVGRLSRATPEEARALADEERRTATDDFACRESTIDPATDEVAAELAPAFVDANRPQLEALMPPEPAGPDGPDQPGQMTVPTDVGTGDVQVTLLWTAAADLDLRVEDPTGASVGWQNPTSGTGGRLDRDANRGCGSIVPEPVENVFWPEGEAPRGDYTVTVTMWSACDVPLPIEFTLVVRIGGREAVREAVALDTNNYTLEFGY